MDVKSKILTTLSTSEQQVLKLTENKKYVSVEKYSQFTEKSGNLTIWTEAFRLALQENENIYIPGKKEPYIIDGTVIIPSDRNIKCDENAVIRQAENVKVLMFRNENTVDGSDFPVCDVKRDKNITITGGRFEESYTKRMGYGKSGMFDENYSYRGVSTLFFFENMENLLIKNVTFANTAGFSVQVGEIKNAIFENICFDHCFADGLHINGNSENIIARNIHGQVGDDLVALNMYDWQNSSVNFGKMKNVLCENLSLSENSNYKAIRIQPGMYYFKDGTHVDCKAENIIFRNVRGIRTFKMYFQTPRYKIGTSPEKGGTGSGNNLFFENIEIDLVSPIDHMPVYMESDEKRGTFAAFELGANIENIYFENINVNLYKDKFPMSYLFCIGPKSSRKDDYEIFDPYLSSEVKTLHWKNIKVNGENTDDIKPYIKEISFDDINSDGNSTACGKILNMEKIN